MSWFVMWRLWSSEWKKMLASNHRKGLLLDLVAMGLHIHPGLNTVVTARLDANVKD